jgi:hypothetical protein
MTKIECEAHIAKDGLVKIEFARPLNEDEQKIMGFTSFGRRERPALGRINQVVLAGVLTACGS